MSTSKSAIKFRRERALQGGGDRKLNHACNVANSHTRPVEVAQTRKPADKPDHGHHHPEEEDV